MKSTQKNNVVFFPRPKKDSPIQNMTELMDQVNEARKATAEIIAEDIVSTLFVNFTKFNVTVKEKDSELFMKDVAMIVEAIKSGVFRSMEFEHPLQNMAEKMFEQINENEIRLNIDRLIIKDTEEEDDETSEEEITEELVED